MSYIKVLDAGYRIDDKAKFFRDAPFVLVERWARDKAQNKSMYILWDPHGGPDGYMISGDNVQELTDEAACFLEL